MLLRSSNAVGLLFETDYENETLDEECRFNEHASLARNLAARRWAAVLLALAWTCPAGCRSSFQHRNNRN